VARPENHVELVAIYEGPTVLADMLSHELRERGIHSIVQAVGPFLGIIGDAARTPFAVVRISEPDFEDRRAQVDECLELVTPSDLPTSDELRGAEGSSGAE
jgi:hypothetical protein